MQNNQGAATQEQSINQENKQETRLCNICLTFFGTAATQFYCSKCYQTILKETSSETKQQKQVVQEIKQQDEVIKMKENPSKCKVCKRKLGISGIQCKCEAYFCNKHRLPEEHQCTFDHAEKAKQLLIKNNPFVNIKKLEEL
ncbi:unnamed protein product (macronuclear) [Paramecium tetraurelia]|uniref:AN1-type domain-containing protein n=1 Tax=Paramecium tetraurelia TaxID=5888 RepID=A0EBY8_PARTE|nr:uncharacterized protein GSPATT00025541001 [Paramecium tetraurelia]CAK92805.1 unnamed protein product [Paramecium tetraurelia]|eukprot:XP_001460202.1 hypothetical protein (macronuclear) [Paramecium tetraurelia strain d4-2]